MNRRHDSCRGSWDTKCTEDTNICFVNNFPAICRGGSYWEADVKDLLLMSSYTLFGVACRYNFLVRFFASLQPLGTSVQETSNHHPVPYLRMDPGMWLRHHRNKPSRKVRDYENGTIQKQQTQVILWLLEAVLLNWGGWDLFGGPFRSFSLNSADFNQLTSWSFQRSPLSSIHKMLLATRSKTPQTCWTTLFFLKNNNISCFSTKMWFLKTQAANNTHFFTNWLNSTCLFATFCLVPTGAVAAFFSAPPRWTWPSRCWWSCRSRRRRTAWSGAWTDLWYWNHCLNKQNLYKQYIYIIYIGFKTPGFWKRLQQGEKSETSCILM